MTYEVMKEYEVWDCPFCKENTISIIHYPPSYSVKRAKTASLPGSKGFHRNPDQYVIKSGCAKCGKTVEEVEKGLKDQGFL